VEKQEERSIKRSSFFGILSTLIQQTVKKDFRIIRKGAKNSEPNLTTKVASSQEDSFISFVICPVRLFSTPPIISLS